MNACGSPRAPLAMETVEFAVLSLDFNNVQGTLPAELSLLSGVTMVSNPKRFWLRCFGRANSYKFGVIACIEFAGAAGE